MEKRVGSLEMRMDAFGDSVKSIERSIHQIADSFDELKRFQLETELHRQEELKERQKAENQRDKQDLRFDEFMKADREEKNKQWKYLRDLEAKRKEDNANQSLKNQSFGTFIDVTAKANEKRSTFWRNVATGVLIATLTGWLAIAFKFN